MIIYLTVTIKWSHSDIMLRDSGYCETTSDTGGVKEMVAQPPIIPVPPVMDSDVREKDSRMTGSSCRALKHAVSALNRLDDFTCEKIGSGFFSEVFKVTHRVTGQVMVLKMNLLRSNRHNMLKEVQLMNQLCHTNILGFMGVCVHEGQLHALTEYINGGSLEQLIQNHSVELTYCVRMKLALDIARGMEYLHSKDVFHRDLTSKNVLIRRNEATGDMTAVVGDFGLAAKIPRSGYRLPTVGSPYWMSPECLKGQWYDERSDVFSYGIILCELIARIEADPDVLPRTENFGLDYLAFIELCTDPPPDFLKLAFSCCNFEPKNRPAFTEIIHLLEDAVDKSSRSNGARSMSCILPSEAEHTSFIAKSEEFLPATSKNNNQHKKLSHRRSFSEDVGLIVFPPHTAPSDKARCHFVAARPVSNPLKHVGETMARNDPYYKPFPSKANPFATLSHFKGVKKILASTNSTDLFSSCFELPSPSPFRIEKPFEVLSVGHKHEQNLKNESIEQSVVLEPVLKPSQVKSNGTLKLTHEKSKQSKDIIDTVSHLVDIESSLKTSGVHTVIRNVESRCFASLKSKPRSLPSSPTFSRRRTMQTLSADIFSSFQPEKQAQITCDEGTDKQNHCETSRKRIQSLFSHPLFKTRETNAQEESKTPSSSVAHPLRSCASSSNLVNIPDCVTTIFQQGSPAVAPGLRRRGSCESGFFSSVGEDFCLPDSSATVSCSLDDIATPLRGHTNSHPHSHKRSSSIYTDSSEDVSSLGGGDIANWDDRLPSQQAPQQISKIVEYFERKQSDNSVMPSSSKWELSDVVSPSLPQHYQLQREYYQLHRSYLQEVKSGEMSKPSLSGPKRGVNQRLMICEGAVRSKLQIFDKK